MTRFGLSRLKTKLGCLFFLLLLGIPSCKDEDVQGRHYVIGFSQCTDDMWRQIMMIQMESEATKYPQLKLEIAQAGNDSDTQIAQIEKFIEQKVDLLVISPNESDPITDVAVKAYEKGIPTIIWDRKINSDRYTTYISADNYQIGRDVGKYVLATLPRGSTILEIEGLKGSSPAQERHSGFVDVVDGEYRIKQVAGDWQIDKAKAGTKALGTFRDIDFVFGHNDDMAIAAYEAIHEVDPQSAERIRFVGIDAIVGVDAVIDGRLDASFLYPPGGEFVIQTAIKILYGEKVDKKYTLKSSIVDRSNAETLKSQSRQILNYQNHINSQRKEIDRMNVRTKRLRTVAFAFGVLALLFVLIALVSLLSEVALRRKNHDLAEQNRNIGLRTNELKQRNDEIEASTARKLRYFVNLSHEIRTPLTLILSPLDKLIRNEKDESARRDLVIVRNNARRLLKIINQIMDLSKVESDKESLKVRQVDIVRFAAEILNYFEAYANNEGLVCKFVSDIDSDVLWIDSDKIEQVLVNVISNAFKNSRKYGVITLSVTDKADSVVIEVHDTGRGIKKEDLPKVFDRFFSLDNPHAQGTGIGLNLSKDYVQMHGGSLSVESVYGSWTSFYIELPKGKGHWAEGAVVTEIDAEGEASKIETDEGRVDDLLSVRYDDSVLVVEDDENIRDYLRDELSANFKVLTAADGYEALKIVMEKDISMVVSDVLMPRINGFQLCRTIKTDMATSHIPVILLTALTEDNQKIYGIAEGADEYIQKPFDIRYLKVKMIRILLERKRLKDSFEKGFASADGSLTDLRNIPTADNAFRDKLSDVLAECYDDSDFKVEELAGKLGISRVQLFRKVKMLFGVSPSDLLRHYRLNMAARLLSDKGNGLTMSEIAYRCGFSSPSYFTRCYKARFGHAPSR